MRSACIISSFVALALASSAQAQAKPAPFVLGGYVEAYYQYNFARPPNGITGFRGFDNRHNSFTLSNVALDVAWDVENVLGRVTLQVGHTPSSYYASEPLSPSAAGANSSDAALWKYLQQAYAGYRFTDLTVAAGLFPSPIGPETLAVRENWSWSRSNLFFGLPFYHTGVRAAYALREAWTVTLAAYNGWSSVVDNNAAKSVSSQLTYTTLELAASVLYFGGVERASAGWRHLFDAHVTWHATPWLSVLVHADGGFEPTHAGVSHWQSAALYARLQLAAALSLAARADVFREHVPRDAAPLFFPASRVGSGTLTLDYHPHEHVSFRLEYRRDQASAAIYPGKSQDTLTLGATSWL